MSTANYCATSPAPRLTFFKSEFLLLSDAFFWQFTWQTVLICISSVDTAALWCHVISCWNPHMVTLSVSGSYWNWVVTAVLWHRHIRGKRRELPHEWMVALHLHRCTWPPWISESPGKLHVTSGQDCNLGSEQDFIVAFWPGKVNDATLSPSPVYVACYDILEDWSYILYML